MTKTTPTRKNLMEAEEITRSFFPDTKPSTKEEWMDIVREKATLRRNIDDSPDSSERHLHRQRVGDISNIVETLGIFLMNKTGLY